MLENLKSKFFVKKQYYIWIISYAIIIFLVLLISLIEHTISIRVVEEEIVQNANRNIAQIENVYDGYFSNIESIGYNLLYSSSVERFIKRPLPQNDSEKTEWIRNVMRDLNTNIASKELISKALLVFRDIDMCIDTSGMYKQKDAFDIMFSGFYANKDAWLSDILATGVKGYKVLTNINGEKKIFFVHPYIDNVYNGKAIMIFEINSDLISKKLASIAGNKNGTIYILNQKNELLFSSVQKPDISFETKEGNGNYIGNINRVKHVFNYVTSARNNWKYIYTIPSSVYSEKIDRIRYTFMVIYLACLFVSIMLAVFFSKKSYKPVKTLMNKLQNGKAHVNGENEFSYIEHKLNDLLLSKSKIEQKVYKQGDILKQNTLAGILTGKIIVKREDITFLVDNDLHFTGHNFAVVMFDVLDQGLLAESDITVNIDNNKIVQFAISNVFTEMLKDVANTDYCVIEDMYVCVVNFFGEKSSYSYLLDTARSVSTFFEENFELQLVCNISELSNDLEKLPLLLEQTKEIIAFRFLDQNQNVIAYDDITNNTAGYHYTLDMENQLINTLIIGDYEKANAFVQFIFDTTINHEKINLSMLRILLSELVSSMLKAIAVVDSEGIIDIKPIYTQTARFNSIKQLSAVRNGISEFLKVVCELAQHKCNTSTDDRSNSIKEYIHSNYCDPNLNVSNIAFAFGLSPNYVSVNFKKDVGVGMADYIVKYRIEKAKELLGHQDKNINNVATETGFSYTKVFIAAFKKIEGITPGQYKRHLPKL